MNVNIKHFDIFLHFYKSSHFDVIVRNKMEGQNVGMSQRKVTI